MSVEKFYGELGGDRLVDSSNYPPEILDYLKCEEQIIIQTFDNYGYNQFVEVGCMDARSLPLAASLAVPYYGIDIVDKYIIEAQNKINASQENSENINAEVHKISVYYLADYLKQSPLRISANKPSRPLAIFPFNSFGNIDSPELAIQSIGDCNMDLLILSYRTDDHSTRARSRYYENCGYSEVIMDESEQGVRFTSPEGLSSVAYDEDYLKDLLGKRLSVKTYLFSEIGVGYHGTVIDE